VPGPGDVLAAMGGVRDGFSEALDLVPRVGALVGRAEDIADRISALLTRVESIVDRADEEIAGVGRTRAKADEQIAGVAHTRAKADDAIAAVGSTQQKADDAIAAVGTTTGRANGLLDEFEPAVTALSPSVRRLAATLEPHEVEAMVTLIDRLPKLVTHLDEDILPILGSLDGVGTDVHDLLDTLQDMRQVVKGFPGSRLFRRRGAEEIAQEEADEAEEAGGVAVL
jgi:ABC-type transporter Mla subunit MlaD